MTYEEYEKTKKELESQLEKLKTDYIEEHGLAIGTPVIFLGTNDGWTYKGVGSLHHVAQRKISSHKGEIEHNILPAKKDGTASKKGAYVYFCSKKHLQVVTDDN